MEESDNNFQFFLIQEFMKTLGHCDQRHRFLSSLDSVFQDSVIFFMHQTTLVIEQMHEDVSCVRIRILLAENSQSVCLELFNVDFKCQVFTTNRSCPTVTSGKTGCLLSCSTWV